MVFLYNFLGTCQQGHIEVYKQHVHMVILFDFLDLMTTVAFPHASFSNSFFKYLSNSSEIELTYENALQSSE